MQHRPERDGRPKGNHRQQCQDTEQCVGIRRSRMRRRCFSGTIVRLHQRKGVTIGANATIVCGVEIGKYAFIGAGAVVTRNVADYALVVGVPGRQIGWMSRHGYRLKFDDDGNAVCPESGIRYVKRGNMVLEYE